MNLTYIKLDGETHAIDNNIATVQEMIIEAKQKDGYLNHPVYSFINIEDIEEIEGTEVIKTTKKRTVESEEDYKTSVYNAVVRVVKLDRKRIDSLCELAEQVTK